MSNFERAYVSIRNSRSRMGEIRAAIKYGREMGDAAQFVGGIIDRVLVSEWITLSERERVRLEKYVLSCFGV